MSDNKNVEIVDDKPLEEKPKDITQQLTIQDNQSIHTAYVAQQLKCENCALRPLDENEPSRCEHFKIGNVCYFTPVRINSSGDIATMVNKMLEIAFNRFFKAALLEKMDGGVLDKAVSDELRRLTETIETCKRIFSNDGGNELLIKAKGKQGTSILGDILKDVLKG